MSKPTKEELRAWQQKNRAEKRPPVSPDQARKELGWDMIEDEQETTKFKKSLPYSI
jgi:hypothetical protein